MQDLELKLRNIIKEEIETELDELEIDINKELIDYGINSAGILNIIINIENTFCIIFKDEDFDVNNFRSMQCLLDFIKKTVNNRLNGCND